MKRAFIVLLLTSCHHDQPKPADPAPPANAGASTAAQPADDPAPCEPAVAHSLKLTDNSSPDAKAFLMRHCRDDGWSVEFRKCVLLANTFDEGVGCESKLTKAQLEILTKDAEANGGVVAKPK